MLPLSISSGCLPSRPFITASAKEQSSETALSQISIDALSPFAIPSAMSGARAAMSFLPVFSEYT